MMSHRPPVPALDAQVLVWLSFSKNARVTFQFVLGNREPGRGAGRWGSSCVRRLTYFGGCELFLLLLPLMCQIGTLVNLDFLSLSTLSLCPTASHHVVHSVSSRPTVSFHHLFLALLCTSPAGVHILGVTERSPQKCARFFLSTALSLSIQ